MLHPDTNNSGNTHTSSSFRSLLAFKPRQVVIAQRNPTPTMPTPDPKDESSTKMTSPEMKGNLHELILEYLHRNGFSKTLKRFRSEAQVQTDAWKASSLHLEDMFYKHNACYADSNKNTSNKPVNDEAVEKETAHPTSVEIITKKKKKKVIVESDDCAIKDQSEVTDQKTKESSKSSGQISKYITVNDLETKSKKKKTKHDLVSSTDVAINGLKIDYLTKKIKDKKKKNIEEVKLEPSTTDENELVTEVAQKKKKKPSTDENETVEPDLTTKDKKSSKKRKRCDENENENVSNKQFDGETNGKLEIDGVKYKKKQRNVTLEPKTVNAFQRVKVDEVEFADDKLQDNSYWAKDGAEIGYGAKAQEVLGQVRGRDFRHEKTKKKRGSYRGGLIDQQSHSIKFNYSDED